MSVLSEPPFHLTRRGWGEFPVRIQIHFKDPRNKRIDIIHQLKVRILYRPHHHSLYFSRRMRTLCLSLCQFSEPIVDKPVGLTSTAEFHICVKCTGFRQET